jgi:predicted phage terminase large subunit-like protein
MQAHCLAASLNYVKYSFWRENGKPFIVSRHHERLCRAIDDVYDGKIKKLIVNIAPRYSKTELFVKRFMANGLAINPKAKFIHLSYSEDLALDNSNEVRESVKMPYYQQIFPYVRLSHNTDSKKKWYTEDGGGVYATSTGGQVTGFGAGDLEGQLSNPLLSQEERERLEKQLTVLNELISELDGVEQPDEDIPFKGALIIDDPLKPDDAISDTKREAVNKRYETTIRSRVNSRNTPIIIIMQRLHEHDLCGYLQELEPDEWTTIAIPCLFEDEDGNEAALWPQKHTVEELKKLHDKDPYVFDTQYQQDPTPIEGLMYRTFRTYDIIPFSRNVVKKNYTDTADTGEDFLCSICYDELPTGNYVTDVLYTDKPMEYTEPETANMLARNETEYTIVESNNGGRGFARNVERILREMNNTRAVIDWFHQKENKQVRIFTKSADVNNMTFFPSDWETRWPAFAKAVKTYRKMGDNAHDDAPDALTGTVEKRGIAGSISDEALEELENLLSL